MLNRRQLKIAFDEIDADKSGSIEVSEIAALCAKVGDKDFDQSSAAELFKEIDTNHDGKVSFEEFTAWYRLGRNSKLRDVLKFQLSAMDVWNSRDKSYKEVGTYAEDGRSDMVDVEIRDGEPLETNTDCVVRLTTQVDPEMIARVKRACPKLFEGFANEDSMMPPDTQSFACFSVKSTNPQALVDALKAFWTALKEFAEEQSNVHSEDRALLDTEFHSGIDGEYAVLAIDAAKNPLTEQFVHMGLSFAEFFDMAKPEMTVRLTSDTTWNCIRESENILNHFDSSRFAFKLSHDNAGRKQLEEVGKAMMQGAPGNMQFGAMGASLFKSFKFKATSNSKTHSGSMNDNCKKTIDALKISSPAQYQMMCEMVGSQNLAQYANWAAILEKVRENKDQVVEFQKHIEKTPFVLDFVRAMKTHAVYDYNLSFVLNNKALSFDSKTFGVGAAFDDLWKIFYD
jgi:hypothetical protein